MAKLNFCLGCSRRLALLAFVRAVRLTCCLMYCRYRVHHRSTPLACGICFGWHVARMCTFVTEAGFVHPGFIALIRCISHLTNAVGTVKRRWKWDWSNGDWWFTEENTCFAAPGNRKMSMSVVAMLVFVSFSYMCMRCVRSNTRSRRPSASPRRPHPSSSSAKVAHPHALTISMSAAEHNLCSPRRHGGSASSSQNMASPCRCTEAGRLHYLPE